MTEITPILVLGVADRDGTPISDPLFAIVYVTAGFLERLTELTNVCRNHRISYMTSHVVEPAPYWDVSQQRFVGLSSSWHVIGEIHYAELSAQRVLQDGSCGKVDDVGSTPLISLCELHHMREHKILIEFRDHENADDLRGDRFRTAVSKRMVAAGIWPAHIPSSVI